MIFNKKGYRKLLKCTTNNLCYKSHNDIREISHNLSLP
uniref:Uncharacterized protein n=1 Tax=Lepeophtheirus salmonis TaxID=72036 RepID=A0A0K2ULD4_LEPSM